MTTILRSRPIRTFFIAVGSVCCLTAVGLALFTHAHLCLLAEAFEERSVSYVQAFASSARLWKDDPETLETAARLLLGGSAVFVQVAFDDELVVDVRSGSAGSKELPPVSSTPQTRVLPTGATYLDIAVTLDGSSDALADYARMGILLASVHAEARNTAWIVAACGLGFVLLVSAVLAWAILGWPGRRTRQQEKPETPPDRAITAGPLRIDAAARSVSVHDKEVQLTPKQFALLRLLAREPGTVFSEREILAAVWPESTYADSKDIKQYVYLIRRRLEATVPGMRDLIETVPGHGYRVPLSNDDLPLTAD